MGSADRRRKARNNKKRTKRISRNTGTLPKTVHENFEEVGSNSGDVVADEGEVAPEVFPQNDGTQNNELPPDDEAGPSAAAPSAAATNEEELQIYFIMNLTVLD